MGRGRPWACYWVRRIGRRTQRPARKRMRFGRGALRPLRPRRAFQTSKQRWPTSSRETRACFWEPSKSAASNAIFTAELSRRARPPPLIRQRPPVAVLLPRRRGGAPSRAMVAALAYAATSLGVAVRRVALLRHVGASSGPGATHPFEPWRRAKQGPRDHFARICKTLRAMLENCAKSWAETRRYRAYPTVLLALKALQDPPTRTTPGSITECAVRVGTTQTHLVTAAWLSCERLGPALFVPSPFAQTTNIA